MCLQNELLLRVEEEHAHGRSVTAQHPRTGTQIESWSEVSVRLGGSRPRWRPQPLRHYAGRLLDGLIHVLDGLAGGL